MIDLANMTENSTLLDLHNRIKALESNGSVSAYHSSGSAVTQSAPITRPAPIQPQTIEADASAARTASEKTSVQEEAQFTPPPISKKADGNDLRSLWEALLSNVKSAPTKAILNLATPVKISAEEIIITFKNEKLVSQFTTTNKKDIVAEAAKLMFNRGDTAIIVRLPQLNDAAISSETVNTVPKIRANENIPVEEEKKKTTAALTKDDNKTDFEQVQSTEKQALDENTKKRLESDQEKMVLELFDGKFIE